MNLIEQLGGYEKAKIYLAKRQIHLKRGDYPESSIEKVKNIVCELEIDLLEYRRQHSIFEVGDLVTYKAHFKGMWREGFGKITEIDEDLEIVNIDENVGVAISEIEHATNEEIKAGKRLEVE